MEQEYLWPTNKKLKPNVNTHNGDLEKDKEWERERELLGIGVTVNDNFGNK